MLWDAARRLRPIKGRAAGDDDRTESEASGPPIFTSRSPPERPWADGRIKFAGSRLEGFRRAISRRLMVMCLGENLFLVNRAGRIRRNSRGGTVLRS